MKMLSNHPLGKPQHGRGFSFFEVMLFVAILGIIVAIAVPMMSNHDAFYAARDRRNAQELVSVNMMANAAGLNFIQGGESVLDILRNISRGAMVTRGAMKGRSFSVPGLSEEDLQGAAKYVDLKNGELRYSFDSVQITQGGTSL
ncbi:MAG: hypothetical protein HS117_17290 [Verrucomicrobiaceae bacterium]|jgi:competence protein ComGC|nr:hypothetical protein [Verrucomicrobiaceae bacterium]